jgi:hypothetical protein
MFYPTRKAARWYAEALLKRMQGRGWEAVVTGSDAFWSFYVRNGIVAVRPRGDASVAASAFFATLSHCDSVLSGYRGEGEWVTEMDFLDPNAAVQSLIHRAQAHAHELADKLEELSCCLVKKPNKPAKKRKRDETK